MAKESSVAEKNPAEAIAFNRRAFGRTNYKFSISLVVAILLVWSFKFLHQNFFYLDDFSYFKRISSKLLENRGHILDGFGEFSSTFEPDETHLKTGEHGAVTSDVEVCSKLGVSILRDHEGNAADAAVTVGLCIGLIESFSAGIGGGGFILSSNYDKDEVITINAREMAPRKAYKDMFNYQEDKAKFGGLAIAIPGELKGLYTLYEKHGSGNVSWRELILPVIELAENGWNASVVLEKVALRLGEAILKNPDDWDFLINKDNENNLIKEGDLIQRKNFANTLRLIANNGSDLIFYDPEGPIVNSLINVIERHGGIITKEDFENYYVKVEPALKTSFKKSRYDVYTTSSSACSGAALIAAINILDGFPLEDLEEQYDLEPIATQRLVETMKWLASARSLMGDNDDDDKVGKQRIEEVLSEDWSDKARMKINDNFTLSSWKDYKPAYEINEPHGTTSFSIVDKYDNAISMISTVNLYFGSMVIDRKTGIILNDEMDDFSIPTKENEFKLQPSIFNFIKPFKRPLSSSAPVIIKDKKNGNLPDLVLSASGGSRITTSILQAIIRIYHYDMTLLESISFPRLHHQLLPNEILVEKETDYFRFNSSDEKYKRMIKEMREKGHKIELISSVSAMNGIKRRQTKLEAVADWWRKRGGGWCY
ncbi:gamma-glutamyltransferase [Ascoidea rubescens DSM 1968]|uniref:Glutathione hydrolase n=1 Tax=Ascoidea rubescens DSM 1968 TaxID=1344418 RepID=A0A1D2VF51_9ASCO|nr:YLR299Wp-like protein [Ascoidea rubescens DSM 1968]ODV60239.1 YLR299Wp-like protein [Ascoidea rubescens DSM 1968]